MMVAMTVVAEWPSEIARGGCCDMAAEWDTLRAAPGAYTVATAAGASRCAACSSQYRRRSCSPSGVLAVVAQPLQPPQLWHCRHTGGDDACADDEDEDEDEDGDGDGHGDGDDYGDDPTSPFY